MEKVEYPGLLINPDSEINIYFEEKVGVNKTRTSVIIEGSRNGFLSLSNMINVYSAYLYDPIVITDFPFVTSPFKFEIVEDLDLLPSGYVIRENKAHFKWKISEIHLCVVICMLHSLGYANNELHLDTDLKPNDISVYCVVK
jgi:hypothetical protein